MALMRHLLLVPIVVLGAICCTRAVSAQQEASQPRPPLFTLRAHEGGWSVELYFLGFIVVYLIQLVLGRAKNESVAIAWTTEMIAPGGVLDLNFSLVGPGDTKRNEVLLRESPCCFKLWASGRRYCQGMLATFYLVKRQDLLQWALGTVHGQRDILDVEVHLSEGACPPMVLAIAKPALARELQAELPDVKDLAKKVEVTRDRLAQWPGSSALTVLAEHSSLLYDLMTPQLMELAFGKSAGWATVGAHFRSLHISSEFPASAVDGEEGGSTTGGSSAGSHTDTRAMIKLSFTLPPKVDGELVSRFLTLALLLTDMVGTYRLSPEQHKRATETRQKRKEAAYKAAEEERLRKQEQRKLAKLQEEKERLRRLPPEARAKELERKQRVQQKRQLSKLMKKA